MCQYTWSSPQVFSFPTLLPGPNIDIVGLIEACAKPKEDQDASAWASASAVVSSAPSLSKCVDFADRDQDLNVDIDTYRCYMSDQWTRVFLNQNVNHLEGYKFLIDKSINRTTELQQRVESISSQVSQLRGEHYRTTLTQTEVCIKGQLNMQAQDNSKYTLFKKMVEITAMRIQHAFYPIFKQLVRARKVMDYHDTGQDNCAQKLMGIRNKLVAGISCQDAWIQMDTCLEWFRKASSYEQNTYEAWYATHKEWASNAYNVNALTYWKRRRQGNDQGVREQAQRVGSEDPSIYDVVKGPGSMINK